MFGAPEFAVQGGFSGMNVLSQAADSQGNAHDQQGAPGSTPNEGVGPDVAPNQEASGQLAGLHAFADEPDVATLEQDTDSAPQVTHIGIDRREEEASRRTRSVRNGF